MGRNLNPYEHLGEEEYIDMDISSATFLCYNISSPSSSSHSREFEFQMSANIHERQPTTSPADELFYKGKLLPLQLPPRLEMVQKLLDNTFHGGEKIDLFEHMTANASNTATTTTATPFESCNISPATSCYVSGELNPEDYFYECSSSSLVQTQQKKSWSKKLKLIKQSSFGLKLKASRAYLKSLFTKSGGCSVEAKVSSNGLQRTTKKNPFGQIQKERNRVVHNRQEEECGHRRSFSGAIKRHSSNKSSSSSSSSSCSSSSNSSSFSSLNSPMLKRSSSVNSEVEVSIQGAIAYCKKSQQLVCGRKSLSDVGLCSLAAVSRIGGESETQERPELCRG